MKPSDIKRTLQATGCLLLFALLLGPWSGALAQVRGSQQPSDPNKKDKKEQGDEEVNKGGVVLEKDSSYLRGPETSRYILQRDWYEIRFGDYAMDTSLVNLHRYNYNARNGYTYQTLGNIGSAMQSMFYLFPEQLGYRPGITAFEPYVLRDEDIRYFNTLSPVTDWTTVLGGDGRSLVDVFFNQNITPYWNVGLNFKRISGLTLIGNQSRSRQNKDQMHTGIMLQTRFESKDERYKLLANYKQYDHTGFETGGLNFDAIFDRNPNFELSDLFLFPAGALVNIFPAGPYTKKANFSWHVYQQYALVDSASLQVFHEMDRVTYRYRFEENRVDGTLSQDTAYYNNFWNYPGTPVYGDKPEADLQMVQFSNTFGAKSRRGPLFLSAYGRYVATKARNRNQSLQTYYIPYDTQGQLYVGGQVGLTIVDSVLEIKGRIENEMIRYDNFLLEAEAIGRYGQASFRLMRYEQDFMRQAFRSPVMVWSNDYPSTTAQRTKIAPKLPLGKRGYLQGLAEFTQLNSYVYYDQKALPKLAEDPLRYSRFGVEMDLKTWKLRHILQYNHTINSSGDILRMPQHFANYSLALETSIKKDKIKLYTGIDVHWHSKYFGYAFMPVTQQFYLQDQQEIGGFPLMDIFVDFRIRRVNAFVKAHNIFGQVGNLRGYYDTPGYMGQRFGIEYGVRWMLFN